MNIQENAMQTETTYVVKGHWPFPVDMLRRDGSRAATPADQAAIDALTGDHAPDASAFVDVEISLVGPSEPNTARWESFSWSVPGDVQHAFVKQERARLAREALLVASGLAKLNPDEREAIEARMAASRH